MTEVWHVEGDNKALYVIDTIDDVKRCVPYKNDIRLIIKVAKLWVINKKYGLTLKLKKIQVKPVVGQPRSLSFLDDD